MHLVRWVGSSAFACCSFYGRCSIKPSSDFFTMRFVRWTICSINTGAPTMNDSEWLRRIHADTQAMKKDTAKIAFASRMMFLLLLACTIKYLDLWKYIAVWYESAYDLSMKHVISKIPKIFWSDGSNWSPGAIDVPAPSKGRNSNREPNSMLRDWTQQCLGLIDNALIIGNQCNGKHRHRKLNSLHLCDDF